jgi:HicB family
MSTLSLRLPESLHRKIRELAERDDISINQFIAMAVAEKTAALLTVDYLEERGRRGSAALFERVLSRVPDVPPVPGDELPAAKRQANTYQPSGRQGQRRSPIGRRTQRVRDRKK